MGKSPAIPPAIPPTHTRLVVSRKVGEVIYVGDLDSGEFIAIEVACLSGKKARLAVVAPKSMLILRDEHLSNPPIKRGSR